MASVLLRSTYLAELVHCKLSSLSVTDLSLTGTTSIINTFTKKILKNTFGSRLRLKIGSRLQFTRAGSESKLRGLFVCLSVCFSWGNAGVIGTVSGKNADAKIQAPQYSSMLQNLSVRRLDRLSEY